MTHNENKDVPKPASEVGPFVQTACAYCGRSFQRRIGDGDCCNVCGAGDRTPDVDESASS